MNNKTRSAALGFAISDGLVWLMAIQGSLIVGHLYKELVAENRNLYPTEFGEAPISMFIMTSGDVLLGALGLTILIAFHWLISLLFSQNQLHKALFANGIIRATVFLAALAIFESAAHDFGRFSLFCGSNEPIYLEFDISYQCARSREVFSWSGLLAMLLPLVAIPVRIFESRRMRIAA